MALITGSSKIDWSGVALEPIDVAQKLDELTGRFDQALTEVNDGTAVRLPPFSSSTTRTFLLSSEATITVRGSGFNTDDPVIKSFEFRDPTTDLAPLNRSTLYVRVEPKGGLHATSASHRRADSRQIT